MAKVVRKNSTNASSTNTTTGKSSKETIKSTSKNTTNKQTELEEDSDEAEKSSDMITRDVCLIILHKALAALQNINTTVEQVQPDLLFASILAEYSVNDQQWFQKCVESYILTGDEEVKISYNNVIQQLQMLTEAPQLDEDSIREDDSIHYDDEIDYVQQYKDNKKRLDIIGKLLRGEIVTDRQKQRRKERAENRIKRAQKRVAKMNARSKMDQ